MSFTSKAQYDATDFSVQFRVLDSTDGTPETTYAYNTTGVDFWYRRGPTGARTAITEATQTVTGAHSDGGLVHVSDGYGRLDLPDAAVASGVDWVEYGGTFTGMVVVGGRVELETASEAAVRNYTEKLFPTDGVIATTTGNTTSAINLTEVIDSSARADDVNGEILAICWVGGTFDGLVLRARVTDYAVTNQLAAVELLSGGVLPEAVAAGDMVFREGQYTADAVKIGGTNQGAVNLATRIGTPNDTDIATDIAAVKTDSAAILVDTAEIGAAGAGLTALATQGSVDTIDTNVDTLLTRIPAALFSGITSLAEWLGLMAGAQTADATALTEIKATGAGSGTYDESTDSMEAIAGAGGGGAPTVTQIRQEMDANSTQLAAILADTNELQTDDVPGLIAALNDPTAAAVADAVLDEALAGHVTAGTLGKAVADIETDVTSIETRLPDALESGRIAATTGSVSNAAIRDGILDRALSSHTTAGTVGKAISDTLADTAELQADDVPGLIAALNDLSSAESQTAAAAAITAAFGITTSTVNDASATTTGFTVTADVSTDIRLGVLRFTDGALAGESRLVTHTGTTIAVVQPTSVPAGLATVGPFSAAVANGVAYTFRPL